MLVVIFDATRKLDRILEYLTARTMARKRKKIAPELKAEWAATMRLLEARIAYHRRRLEERRTS